MQPVSPKELDELIADMSLAEEPFPRICLALIELRHARRRWRMLKFALPCVAWWIERRAVRGQERHYF
jgi:hypothetical protein